MKGYLMTGVTAAATSTYTRELGTKLQKFVDQNSQTLQDDGLFSMVDHKTGDNYSAAQGANFISGNGDGIGLDFGTDNVVDMTYKLNFTPELVSQLLNSGLGFTQTDIDVLQGKVNVEDAAKGVTGTGGTGSADRTTIKSIPDNIANLSAEQLQALRQQNLEAMDDLEGQIEEHALKAKEEIEKAIDEAKKIEEDKKEATKAAVKKGIDNYTAKVKQARQEGKEPPEDLTMDSEIQSAINSSGDIPSQAATVTFHLVKANAEISLVESLVSNLSSLISETKQLETQIKTAEAATKSCDPYGFFDDAGNEYDLVYFDEDGNIAGVVGATEGETQSVLDGLINKNTDKKWDADEISSYSGEINGKKVTMGLAKFDQSGNLSGKIQGKDAITKELGTDFAFDFTNYNTNVTDADKAKFSKITFDKDENGNNTADHTLRATLNVTSNGKTYDAYQTDEDAEIMNQRFGTNVSTQANPGAAAASLLADVEENGFTKELNEHEAKIKGDGKTDAKDWRDISEGNISSIGYENVVSLLRAGLAEATQEIGLESSMLQEWMQASKEVADAQADGIYQQALNDHKADLEAVEQKLAEGVEAKTDADGNSVYVKDGFICNKNGEWLDKEGNVCDEASRVEFKAKKDDTETPEGAQPQPAAA